MIMDEKGKLFGRISIVDLCVMILVLALLAGAYYKFFVADRSHVAAKFDTIEYKVLIRDIRSVDYIEVGADVYDSKTATFMGKITAKESRPATNYITRTDGTMVIAEKPERYDAVVTIQVPGVENRYGYMASGNRDISRDTTVYIETKMISVEAKVTDVKNLSKEK